MIDLRNTGFLYAEDDPDDRLLAEMAHRESGAANPLTFVRDGEEALECLRLTGRYSDQPDTPRPGVVLLDLNMPGIDGRETLRIIRADPAIRRIPVVILTTSAAEADISASYEAGANAYIVKPTAFGGLVRIFAALTTFWFDVSSLPKETAP
jgi:two-component system response regulator